MYSLSGSNIPNVNISFLSVQGKFLQGRRMSQVEDQCMGLSQDSPKALYQNELQDYEDESHFSTLMESLGASNIFEESVSLVVFDKINIGLF